MSNDGICSFNWRMIERYKVNPIRLENTGGGVGQIGKAMIAIVRIFNQHTQISIPHWANILAQARAKQVD
jgi:hypothetical protein